MDMRISLWPTDANGNPVQGKIEINPMARKIGQNVILQRALEMSHFEKLKATYGGDKIKSFVDDEIIEKRATALDSDSDEVGSGAYLYESLPEMCEKRGLDHGALLDRERKYLDARSRLITRGEPLSVVNRGLDGGTDTALVAPDYLAEWLRIMRMTGDIVPRFSRQVDIAPGKASLIAPIVGDAQFLKVGALTTNLYSVNPSVNPTSTQVTWTPQKAMAVIFISGELKEDSLVPIIENLMICLTRGAATTQTHQLISGDSLATTGNINSYNSAAQNTGLGSQDPRLCYDGLRAMDYKSAVGKSAGVFGGVDGGNAIATLASVSQTLLTMGKFGSDPKKVLTIAPVCLEQQFMQDAKARPFAYGPIFAGADGNVRQLSGTQPVFMNNSTIDNTSDVGTGAIPTYATFTDEGYPTNLDSSGRYSGTGNTRTGFTCVREDNILIAWKRQWHVAIIDLGLGDQYAVTASYRWVAKQIQPGYGVRTSYNCKSTN